MDVLTAEAQKLRQLVQTWSEHDNYELECTFGQGGKVDATTFFAIAQRLRSKGFESLAQEDRLNIILPERIRITLTGSGIIQQYCRDDTISGKQYSAMIKDRTFVESNLDLDEYDVRVKLRREIELAPDDARIREVMERWAVHRKAFRLIRRYSFVGRGVQFDLSIVRSTKADPRGDFRWVRSFREHNFLKETPTYEVEVELKRTTTPGGSVDVDGAIKDLVRGVGEVLRGVQRNSLLMRKSVRERVLAGYRQLTGTDLFRGVAPITLETKNMTTEIEEGVPNIRSGYNVTDKADGLRVLAYTDRKGELYMLDMAMNVYKTGLMREVCRDALLDGEWITKDKKGDAISQLLIFDVYVAPGGARVDDKPFVVGGPDGAAKTAAAIGEGMPESRYSELRRFMDMWNEGDGPTFTVPAVNAENKLLVAEKRFYFAAGNSIFKYAARTLEKERPYHTDGLILTPNALPLPGRPGDKFAEQFKWKPASENTIDFLVNFEKAEDAPTVDKVRPGINPNTNETTRYKIMRLYVGSSTHMDPRAAILYDAEKQTRQDKYRPVLFNPSDFPDTMASIAYRPVEMDLETGDEFVLTEGTNEPIRDRSIVEMAYDPSREPGWRWYPLRVRHDKTERLQRGILARTLNGEAVAESVWNSIHDPITTSMIRTGAEEPTEEEVAAIQASRAGMEDVGKKYYERKAPEQDLMAVRGLRDFHNRYIKEDVLLRPVLRGGGKRLIDIGCGKAGDLQKWRRGNIGFALGIDPAGENIRNPKDGAYARYYQTMKKGGAIAPMVFVIGDASLRLTDGTAGSTPEEKDILRAVFGVAPEGAVPPFLETKAAGALRAGADVITSMFTLHYFFESADMLNGLVANINDTLKVGGYFVGCCFDGRRIFDSLKMLPRGQSKVGKSGEKLLWTITKEYDAEDLTNEDDSIGLAIDVEFISIGSKQREYLVPFDLLVDKMKAIGLDLMTGTEARAIGLQASTNLFDVSYAMAAKGGKKFPMEDSVKEFSFFNRWFVFKRRGTGNGANSAEQSERQNAVVEARERAEEAAGFVVAEMEGIVDAAPVEEKPAALGTAAAVGAEMAGLPTVGDIAAPTVGIPTLKVRRTKTAAAAAGAGGAGISVIREVPVSAPTAAGRSFPLSMVYQFHIRAAQPDARWLDPIAPFPIKDEEDGIIYPSMEHYIAGMKFKMATDKPQLAVSVASQQGAIHQEYLRERGSLTGAGARPLGEDQDNQLLQKEAKQIKLESSDKAITSKWGAMYNDAAWLAAKNDVLRYALQYRWTHDKRFRSAVEKAREAGKYLLYYTGSASGSELGGKRRSEDGVIDGANKVGKIIMQLANFAPF
jgi:SAM-dependent methyltransferase